MKFPIDPLYASRRSPVLARNVVTTSHPLATEAGLAMLRKGGNAVDAALAAAMTLTVVEPTGNGLGSDAFCILWDGKELHGLNASGRSPAGWTQERFSGHAVMPQRGWESVTVPGAVSSWVELSQRFGKLPFETLFEPAIEYASRGFHVSPIIGELWRRGAELLNAQPGFAEAFMPGGRPPVAGEIFRSEAMARSLRLIAETKGEAFYRGELADKIAAFASKHGAVFDSRRSRCPSQRLVRHDQQGFRDFLAARNSAERSGHRGPDGPRHVEGNRDRRSRPGQRGGHSPPDRGDEARLQGR
jgi:gamma-glutamyltranspeptidase/glutathione hydrolase